MGRLILSLGVLLLIAGFVTYQAGFSIAFHGINLLPILPGDLTGVALEFTGGIVGIIGFVMCLLNITPTGRERVSRGTGPILKEKTPTRICRFCGAEMDKGAVFCPVCNRAQG